MAGSMRPSSCLVRTELKDTTLLLDEEVVSASSGKKIHRLIAKKNSGKKPRPAGEPGGA